jgi:hypothetical protein
MTNMPTAPTCHVIKAYVKEVSYVLEQASSALFDYKAHFLRPDIIQDHVWISA